MRERESDRGEDEGEGECEGVGVAAWRRPGHPDEEGRGQAGREGGGVARWRACAPGTQLLGEVEKTTEEEAGWAACWLGRPAAAGLHRGGAPGKPLLPFIFVF